MLHVIQSISDPRTALILDDPVRPEIPISDRINQFGEIFVLCDDLTHQSLAVVCCAYRDFIPADCSELQLWPLAPTVAVFYTIWSYKPGSAQQLILAAQQWIRRSRPEIREFVTLSPPTDMARRFHIKNGAQVCRINSDTVNYSYSSQ